MLPYVFMARREAGRSGSPVLMNRFRVSFVKFAGTPVTARR